MIFNNLMMSAVTGFALIGLLQSPAIQSVAGTTQVSGDISKAEAPEDIKKAVSEAGISDPSFAWAISHILKVEGGWSNHPADGGGKTKFGIIESVAKRHGINVSTITLPQAIKIYYQDYWLQSGADKAQKPLNLAIMNSYVNSGKKWDIVGSTPSEQAQNYIKSQDDYYTSIYTSRPSQKVFANGWHRRTKYMMDAVNGKNPSW
jgi:Glycosyl hydrolase 108